MPVMPTTTARHTAVFAFQLCGCAYQPPEGDQTCFGYGILPPPPIVRAVGSGGEV